MNNWDWTTVGHVVIIIMQAVIAIVLYLTRQPPSDGGNAGQ